MTWASTTAEQLELARGVVLWIETARAAGYGGSNWLPSDADIYKSALFERIRSGKRPLDEPPPRGFSCPWYALVEDRGPHYVGDDVWNGPMAGIHLEKTMFVFQHPYAIVEERGEHDMVVRDATRDTSYRFLLWFDPTWVAPCNMAQRAPGGWFIQNLALTQGVQS